MTGLQFVISKCALMTGFMITNCHAAMLSVDAWIVDTALLQAWHHWIVVNVVVMEVLDLRDRI